MHPFDPSPAQVSVFATLVPLGFAYFVDYWDGEKRVFVYTKPAEGVPHYAVVAPSGTVNEMNLYDYLHSLE